MIDERQEELAALYAFDLLEGAERADFEAAVASDPALDALVQELRAASTSLAHLAPRVAPPAALRSRVFASIAALEHKVPPPDNVIRPVAFTGRVLIPWAVAACLALGAAWLGQRYAFTRSEAGALRQQLELADITLKSTQQQLEAERIVTRRQVEETGQQLSSASSALAEARAELIEARIAVMQRDRQLAEARTQLDDRERLLAENRAQLTDRERQVADLTQRAAALGATAASSAAELTQAQQQVAKLSEEMKAQGDLANLKITALASMLKNSPLALAVAVWDPRKQEGILDVRNLPALAANEDYQLWVVDPQYPNPVDAGVFTVEPATGTRRVQFKATQPITAVNAFAVTRERKGGVTKAQGPFVLLSK